MIEHKLCDTLPPEIIEMIVDMTPVTFINMPDFFTKKVIKLRKDIWYVLNDKAPTFDDDGSMCFVVVQKRLEYFGDVIFILKSYRDDLIWTEHDTCLCRCFSLQYTDNPFIMMGNSVEGYVYENLELDKRIGNLF